MKKQTLIILIVFIATIFSDALAQNTHFGMTDKNFLWGVSGGVVMPSMFPNTAFPNITLRPGYDFGLDFRHKLGNRYYRSYYVFLHYGVNMGSFFYKTTDINAILLNEQSPDFFFYDNTPIFLHLDLPIGVEFPLGYFCNNRLSFNFCTSLTSRFYFFHPNQIYNLASTNSLAFRFDKIQLEAAYSFFLLSQFSKNTYMELPVWKTRELLIGLKFYF